MMVAPESLKNFFALTWQSPRPPVVKRIDVSYGLQHELTDLFDTQVQEFLDGEPKPVPFDGRYQVDDSEISVIRPFTLAPEIVEAVTHPHLLEKLDPDRDDLSQIRSIFASSRGSGGVSPKIEFQGFDRTRLLGYKFSILGSRGVFRKLDETGLALDTKLAALFEGDTLWFRSPAIVKRFLNIVEFFSLATDQEIVDILSHDNFLISDQDKEAFSKSAKPWYRRRFTAIRELGILDTHSPLVISNRAKKFGFEVELEKSGGVNKLAFPRDKAIARALVKLLAEELFEGVFTGRAYQTNSMKEIDGKAEGG